MLINGDCEQELKKLEDNSVDLICTDPPYGYSFMNKDWDKAVVSVDVWKECLRVLKAGSFAFVMSAPRQDVLSHMIVNLSDAGFKTDFTSIYWAYATGFPKAMNISKAVDKKLCVEPVKTTEKSGEEYDFSEEQFTKQGSMMQTHSTSSRIQCYNTIPNSEQAKKLDGSYAGFQPKPAVEVILVCMKPLSEKNYVEQAMKNEKGVTWLDDCRIPYENNIDLEKRKRGQLKTDPLGRNKIYGKMKSVNTDDYINNDGRFPANLIVSDNSLDTGKKTKSQRNLMKPDKGGTGNSLQFGDQTEEFRGFDDSGDFSRYFSLDSWEAQFIITPKPSKSEKNKGLDSFLENSDEYGGKFPCSKKLEPHKVNDGRNTPIDNPFQRGETIRQNVHPTVKPISLMKYLITMGSRPKDTVLDPFMGSGTTAISSILLNREWIGIEQNPEYCEIIKARVSYYQKQMRLKSA